MCTGKCNIKPVAAMDTNKERPIGEDEAHGRRSRRGACQHDDAAAEMAFQGSQAGASWEMGNCVRGSSAFVPHRAAAQKEAFDHMFRLGVSSRSLDDKYITFA